MAYVTTWILFGLFFFCSCTSTNQNVEVNKKVSAIKMQMLDVQMETAINEDRIRTIDDHIRELSAQIEFLRFENFYHKDLIDSLENKIDKNK